MSPRPVIDAGPALNFLAANQQRLLLRVLGKLSTPETVEAEILQKAGTDRRFKGVDLTWSKLTPKWIEVLSDDITDELDSACQRITATGLAERKSRASDLGELMVIAHAVTEAEHRGTVVTVVIDDQAGATLATAEAQRLNRLRAQGRPVGTLLLVNTIGILQKGVIDGHIQNRSQMRMIYDRLYGYDDGLPPIDRTPLLSGGLWNSKETNRIQ
ncbi:hypothetical protein K7711_07750 [Nocardia sp. CA2R105]|uniref:hypothetical protein n=1 Tax=Nocardia coffeae TaxID=2873381 RepID=UPI001CA6238B|nr:hypothetical protein [Nocardia coffeae]MBY8856365.1 hypothetical protein [Nocardia coffeae]